MIENLFTFKSLIYKLDFLYLLYLSKTLLHKKN